MYDLIIIGGGPAGYVAAERAGHKGLSVLLFEKKSMGGVCLNEGCIPTKTMLYSAKTYENALHGDKYGVYGDNIRFDYGKIVARKNKVVRKLVAGVEGKMKLHHVTVVKGEAMIQGRSPKGVEVTCGNESYLGTNLLICTGSEAFVPPIPGLAGAGDIILTNREILDLKEQPTSLVVIGGGVIGISLKTLDDELSGIVLDQVGDLGGLSLLADQQVVGREDVHRADAECRVHRVRLFALEIDEQLQRAFVERLDLTETPAPVYDVAARFHGL